MVVSKILFLRHQQAPSCQRKFLGNFCLFMDEISYSQSNWVWSRVERALNTGVGDGENQTAVLLTESVKMRMELSFCLTMSTNRESIRLFHKSKEFCLFWLKFGCAWLWLVEKFLQKWKWFFVIVVMTSLSDKTICAIALKQQIFGFLVHKRKIQHVAARFALPTFVTTFIYLFQCKHVDTVLLKMIPSRTIDISNSILNWFLSLFKSINHCATLPEKRSRLFFRGNVEHVTRGPALRKLIIVSAERLKSLFVYEKCTRTHWNRTLNVPIKFKIAFVIQTIRGECATRRTCFQKILFCLQRKVGSCRRVDFAMVKVDSFCK